MFFNPERHMFGDDTTQLDMRAFCGADWLAVYAAREHFGNIFFLVKGFEKAYPNITVHVNNIGAGPTPSFKAEGSIL